MNKKYDVIIIGGGPAGLFAALELSRQSRLNVLLIEKGKDIDRRRCPGRENGSACTSCSPCHMVCGLGGAGAFSDGKLTLSAETGGLLAEYRGKTDAEALIKYVDDIYLKFGASKQLYGAGEKIYDLRRRAYLAGLRLVPQPVRHLGTDHCRSILKAMRDDLGSRIDLRLSENAARVITGNGKVTGVETQSGEIINCEYLILAPGREGADWLSREAERLKLNITINPVDVGVRVEVPNGVMQELTNELYEAKLEFVSKSFDDRIRTFCMCPGGEVTMESTGGADPVISVNGHSYAEPCSDNTNFAILVSTTFTKPFHEPIAYGKYLARLANILSGGVLVQRLGDLMKGHRSTTERLRRGLVVPTLKSATPGDLSYALPYRHLTGIIEMLQAMDRLAPGVASSHTLLYGVEVKFYSCRLQLNPDFETGVRNMFAAGDGAGVSRGLVQASASGTVAAREILRRADGKST